MATVVMGWGHNDEHGNGCGYNQRDQINQAPSSSFHYSASSSDVAVDSPPLIC